MGEGKKNGGKGRGRVSRLRLKLKEVGDLDELTVVEENQLGT